MRLAGGTPDLTKSRRLGWTAAPELGHEGCENGGSPAAADGCPLVELALSLQDGRAMARRSALLALLLLAPSLAAAQTITITESNDQDNIVSLSECTGGTDQLSFTWVASSTTSNLDLWASNQASCPQPSTSNTSAKTVSI